MLGYNLMVSITDPQDEGQALRGCYRLVTVIRFACGLLSANHSQIGFKDLRYQPPQAVLLIRASSS